MKEFKLKQLFDLQMGKTPKRKESKYWKNGVNDWISISDLSNSRKYINQTSEKITDIAVRESGIKVIPKNTVVMSFKLSIGKVAITEHDMYSNEAVMAFHDRGIETILPEYLYYLLSSKDWNEGANKAVKGITLNKTTLSNIKIKIHKASEQAEIIKILSNIEGQISYKKDLLIKYDYLIKSRFVEMFGQCDLNKRQNNWFKLGNVTEIVTGTTPSTHIEENWNGKHLWITPAEIKDDSFYIYDTERKLSDIGLSSKSLRVMPINTVLLSTRAPIGKTAIVGKPMTCNQGFKNFICKDKLNPIFLYILLKFNTDYLNSIGSGTTFKEISKTVVSNIEIPVPPIELQNEFASFVKQVDKLKFENEILYSISRFTINKQTKLLGYRGVTL
jgi:restriction endonuclease S subunit